MAFIQCGTGYMLQRGTDTVLAFLNDCTEVIVITEHAIRGGALSALA